MYYWFIVYYTIVDKRSSSEEILVCQGKYETFLPGPVEEAISKKINTAVKLTAYDQINAEDVHKKKISTRVYLSSSELKNA